MSSYTFEDYRARLQFLRYAEENVKSCERRERIESYLPGQVIYLSMIRASFL